MPSVDVEACRSLKRRRCTIACLEDNKGFYQERALKAWSSLESLECAKQEPSIKAEGKEHHTVKVNVGGKVFHIPKKCAINYPNTRIGSLAVCQDQAKLLTLCDDYSHANNEFFFDRDPAFFHNICHFYSSGMLWIITEMCPISFKEEVAYWGLNLKNTPLCCWLLLEERVDEMRENIKVESELMAELEVTHDDGLFQDMALGEVRKKLWNIVENPYSSFWGKVFTVLSNVLVLVSIMAMTLNTVEELQKDKIYGKSHMEWVESFTIVFFAVEYFIRLASTPKIKSFLKSGLNFVDMVAVVPYFVQMVFEVLTNSNGWTANQDLGALTQVSQFSHILRIVKLLRIFRILKLARHSTGMRAFGFTLRQCYQQASCILLFIAMGIFTFSALLHSAEKDVEGTPISSIPYAWWWAAVSISTVGYGDVVPVTILGRIVAFVCISFGIILNGMPISFLFNKFSDYYSKLKARENDTASNRRRIMLKKRLRRKMDFCFHPEEDSAGTASET
ncbi:potassium voltage-gated channel subfamily V member 2-like [Neosynchiropus ocellatus]